jgi:hypothetical protein
MQWGGIQSPPREYLTSMAIDKYQAWIINPFWLNLQNMPKTSHHSPCHQSNYKVHYKRMFLVLILTYIQVSIYSGFNKIRLVRSTYNLSELEVSNISKFFLVACEIRMFSYSEMGIDGYRYPLKNGRKWGRMPTIMVPIWAKFTFK